MDLSEILMSPLVVTLLTGLLTGVVGLVGTSLGARIQRTHDREVERDRFRHDIASRTAEVRLIVYRELAAKVAATYREKVNWGPRAKDLLNETKNHYYDHRFFFSPALGQAFRQITNSLAADSFKKEQAEDNLNQFFNVVRDDLLLKDLSDSVGRAVVRDDRSQSA